MHYINYRNIRIQQIQIFLSVAECGNFTATAEQLHVTQPMVSKTIQSLEHETGIILFRKDHGKPCLTPAGRALSLAWANILELFETSICNAQSIQEAKNIPLRFGLGMSSQREDVKKFIDVLKEKCPAVDFLLECGNMSVLLQRVHHGELDMAICSGHLLPNVRRLRLNYKLAVKTSLSIFVPDSNPLARKNSLVFSDLCNEAFITYAPESDPLYWELLNSMASKAGFRPQIACYVKDELSFQINLESGRGILLADSGTLNEPGIRKFVLDGTECGLYLIWKGNNHHPSLEQVLKAV